MPSRKQEALSALKRQMRAELDHVSAAQQDTQDGAFHEDNRPENDKDTRLIEASYLARGLAQRVEMLHQAVAYVNSLSAAPLPDGAPIGAPALVTLENEAEETRDYLVCPVGGGARLHVGGTRIMVVTPAAPLGLQLVGRRVGHEVELPSAPGTWVIDRVE